MKRVVFFAIVFSGELVVLYFAGTDETRVGLAEIAGHPVVQLLLCVVASWFVASLALGAYRRRESRLVRQRQADRSIYRAELRTKGYAVVPESIDASSLLDDSESGHLPDEWRAHCGELVHLPSPNNGGPRAA